VQHSDRLRDREPERRDEVHDAGRADAFGVEDVHHRRWAEHADVAHQLDQSGRILRRREVRPVGIGEPVADHGDEVVAVPRTVGGEVVDDRVGAVRGVGSELHQCSFGEGFAGGAGGGLN